MIMRGKLRSLSRRLRRCFASIDSGQLRHRTVDDAGRFFLWRKGRVSDGWIAFFQKAGEKPLFALIDG
ncbi:hypothetical protein AP057_00210 [Geobacillus sp. Sah69]|nr:hypothetical protein AP057_00210 [Geobacillus sp. Sah69]